MAKRINRNGASTFQKTGVAPSADVGIGSFAVRVSASSPLNTGNFMILELADIRIQPGQQAAFDDAIQRGVSTVIAKAKGFQGYKINKGIETPERYILQIFWDTLENHTVDFRESPAFAQWRAIVGPFFAGPPTVEHFNLLAKSD
jgi:heme-degrading monooxygenase HmoA